MRILNLCGYKQNASILRKWTTSLREECEDVEFGASSVLVYRLLYHH